MGGKEVSPITATASCIEKASTWCHRKDMTQEEPKEPLRKGGRAENVRRGLLAGQSTANGRAARRKNPRDRHRVTLGHSIEYRSAHACEESIWGKGKNYSQHRGNSVQVSHKAGNSACSLQPDWRTYKSSSLGWVFRKVLPR